MGHHDLGLALVTLRVIEEPQGGQVHHDALPRGVGKHELGRQDDPGPGSGQPRVHPRIRRDDLVVPQPVTTGKVRQRVLVPRDYHLDPSDDVRLIIRQHEAVAADRIAPGQGKIRKGCAA
jgi:hypothetical protein